MQDALIVGLQIALAAVLAIAATGKFLDLPGSRRALEGFADASRYANALGVALPVGEAVLAAGLLIGPVARGAALFAALLFATFAIAIAWNLRHGRHPDCHCFGQIHSEPAGPATLIRNAVLFLGAFTIVVLGAVSIPAWIRGLSEGATVALVFVVIVGALGGAQIWLARELRLQNERILERLDALTGAPAGGGRRAAPAFDIPSLDGGRLTLAGLLERGKPTLLLFVDPGCGPCRSLAPDMAEWHRRFSNEISVAWISRGTEEANRDKFGEAGVTLVGLQAAREVYTEYGVSGTPSAVLVDADGIIRTGYATGRDRIRELIAFAVSRAEGSEGQSVAARPETLPKPADPESYLRVPKGPEAGTKGTRVPLPDLDGGYASLDDYLGEEAVLLFVGAECTFTKRMIPELQEWESEAGAYIDRVLLVSMGTVEANREFGLKSRIVLDDGFTTANLYGATGTPAAIRLDAEGRVASPLAVGNDAVLDLLWERIESDGEKAPAAEIATQV